MEKISKIFFRADGNSQIGLGHVTRSLALADMLKERFEIFFLIQEPSEQVIAQIREVTNQIVILPKTENYLEEAQWITQNYLTGKEIVVLDGYHFQTEYQKVIKATGVKLVCIDDLHAWHFVADVVINHAGSVSESDYSCEPYTKLCLGLEYALLRKPFLEAAKQHRKIDKIENAFICFGGSDPNNFTEKALKACIEADIFKQIHVVVGSAYAYYEVLKDLIAKEEKNVFLYQNLDAKNLCEVMQKCHVGIVPASSIAYECLAAGIRNFFLVQTTYNQKLFFNGIRNLKDILVVAAESFKTDVFFAEISRLLAVLDNSQVDIKNYFNRVKNNYIKTLLEIIVEIRHASEKDVDLYYKWVNDPEVRLNSINQEFIKYEDHCAWFYNKIKNNESIFFVGSIFGMDFGQLRIDLKNEKGYINYSISSDFRGMSLGKILVTKVMKSVRITEWIAYVYENNIKSQKVFQDLGFSLSGYEVINGRLFQIYTSK